MHRILASSDARPSASFRAVVFLAVLYAAALSGCGGGGSGSSSGGGTPPPAPANQPGTISISGTPTQGQALSATVQDGNGVPNAVLYQWIADGNAISGETGKSLILTQAQVGKAISVRGSYTDPNNFTENPTSASTAPVADANVLPKLVLSAPNIVTTDFSRGNDIIYGLETLADGKILAVGTAATSKTGSQDFALARYLPDGKLDPSFGNAGRVTTDFSGFSDFIYSKPAITADGHIVVAGAVGNNVTSNMGISSYVATPSAHSPYSIGTDIGLARYSADGVLDASFGNAGKVRIDIAGFGDRANAIAIDAQSRILVAGGTINPATGNTQFVAIRLTADGTLDSTFGTGGKATIDFSAFNGHDEDYANDVLVQPDGKILLSGLARDDFGLVRLNSNGSLDATFGSGGMVSTDPGAGNGDEANHMALRPDGKILLAGYSGQPRSDADVLTAVIRYNADGSVDRNFGVNGLILTDLIGQTGIAWYSEAYDIRLDGNNFYVAGTHYSPWRNGRHNLAVMRYLEDGRLDTAFGKQGAAIIDMSGNLDFGYALALTSNGSLLIGGRAMNHTDYTTDFAIAKIYRSGDPTAWAGLPQDVYIEAAGTPVRLTVPISIGDDDASIVDSYAGYVLTIQRRDAPSPMDHFVGSGALSLASDGNVILDGIVIGQHLANNGKLTITFNPQAQQKSLYSTISQISYWNSDPLANQPVTLDWTFSDDMSNKATASSRVVIANDYTDINDPHLDFGYHVFDNLWRAGETSFYTTMRTMGHDDLDAMLNVNQHVSSTWPSTYFYSPNGTSHMVSLATVAEIQQKLAVGPRPEGFTSGEYWSATSLGSPDMYSPIDMATGAVRSTPGAGLLRAVVIVRN